MSVKEQYDPTIVTYVNGCHEALVLDLMGIYGISESLALRIIRDVATVHTQAFHAQLMKELFALLESLASSKLDDEDPTYTFRENDL